MSAALCWIESNTLHQSEAILYAQKESIFGYYWVPFGTRPILLELQKADSHRTLTGPIWYPSSGLRIYHPYVPRNYGLRILNLLLLY